MGPCDRGTGDECSRVPLGLAEAHGLSATEVEMQRLPVLWVSPALLADDSELEARPVSATAGALPLYCFPSAHEPQRDGHVHLLSISPR